MNRLDLSLAMRRIKRRLDAHSIEAEDHLTCPICRKAAKTPQKIYTNSTRIFCCGIELRLVIFSDKKEDDHYATLTAIN